MYKDKQSTRKERNELLLGPLESCRDKGRTAISKARGRRSRKENAHEILVEDV